jgi:hypothetical protein
MDSEDGLFCFLATLVSTKFEKEAMGFTKKRQRGF